MAINYYSYTYEENEHLYGPGKRLVLFMQGCSIHCQGCVNEHLWEFEKGTNIKVSDILKISLDVEGITLHGGEPLDQSDDLLELIIELRKINKTIILFTGYKYKELKTLSAKKAWKLSDIVISGRYEKDKKNIYLQFRGSTNQRVYVHKGKYEKYKIKDGKTIAILRLSEDGLSLLGFQNDELESFIQELRK